MQYVAISEVSRNTHLTVAALNKIIRCFNLVVYQRRKSTSIKILASDLDLIVRCDYLYQKGFSIHEMSRITRKNINLISKLL